MRFQYQLAAKNILDEVNKFVSLKQEVEQLYNRRVVLSEGFEKFINDVTQSQQLSPNQLIKRYSQYKEYLYRRTFFLLFLRELHQHIESLEVPADNIFGEPTLPIARRGLQTGDYMLPNLIVKLREGKEYTIFFEVPSRMMPPGYETSPTKLPEEIVYVVNILYGLAMIDIGVVKGHVNNFLDFTRIPPVREVDLAVVCRAESEWWSKLKDVREPGLIESQIAEIASELSMKPEDIVIKSRDPRTKTDTYYMKEVYVIPLIRKIYRPKKLILMSKVRIDRGISKILNNYCDVVYESTMLNIDALREAADKIIRSLVE